MAINPDMSNLLKEIDRLLAEQRPDRYTISNTTTDDDPVNDEIEVEVDDEEDGDSWLDVIADDVAPLLPEVEVRKLYARKLVGQQEGRATRRTNRLLRKIGKEGQLVFGWWGVTDDPVAIETRILEPGKRPRIKRERVALRAMTPFDFRTFATEERRRAANDLSARNETCNGAEFIDEHMTAAGFSFFKPWAEQEFPPDTGDDDGADPS